MKRLLNGQLSELSTDKSFMAINNYLKAFRQVFIDIENTLENHILKPVVLQAVLAIAPNMFVKTLERHNKLTYEAFYQVLKILKQNIARVKITRPGNSYKKLSENLLEALTRVHIQANIIVEE